MPVNKRELRQMYTTSGKQFLRLPTCGEDDTMSGLQRLVMFLLAAFFSASLAEGVGAETAPAAPAAPAPVTPAAPAPVTPAAPAPATAAPAAAAPAAPAPRTVKPSEKTVWAGHMSAAEIAFKTRDYAKVEAELMAAVKVAEGFDEKDERLASSLVRLMQTYATQDKHADAVGPGKRLVALREKAHGADHIAVGAALNDLAGQYKDLEKFDEALPLYTRSLAIAEKTGARASPLIAIILNNLAQIYRDQGKLDDAEKSANRALAIRSQVFGAHHDWYADSVGTLGTVYAAQGKHAESEALFRRVLDIRRKTQVWNRPVIIKAMADVADACKAQEKFENAETFYKAALRTGEDGLGKNDGVRADVYQAYADLLKKLKRDDEANQMAEQARIIRNRLAAPGGGPSVESK